MRIKSILREELERISLSRMEILNLSRMAKKFIGLLKEAGLRAYIGGSFAKGTMVRKSGLQDVDIFVVFDYSDDISKLGKVLKKIKLPGKLKKVHGSRDYFQVVCDSVLLEIVPVVKNRNPELAKNVTDVSLSHVKYIKGAVKDGVDITGEIKLAKVFCRANRCYGAEGYVRGFSGYSLEILVIHFGGFVKFLRGIRKGGVIDPMKYFRNKHEIMRELNASKLDSPIVLIDPTYKYRNVCAGLGVETFVRFVSVVNDFLKRPSLDFFERKEIDVDEMRRFASRKGARFVEVGLKTDRQIGDIAGTKMKKLLDFFERELVRKGQNVLGKEFDYDGMGGSATGYLVVLEKMEIEVRGPPVRDSRFEIRDSVKAFKKANAGKVFEKKGFWWCRKMSGVDVVLGLVKKVEGEMGAWMIIK